MPAAPKGSQLAQLQTPFKPAEHAQRQGRGNTKLTYISIDATINRVNDVLGSRWGIERAETTVLPPTEPGGNWFAKTELFVTATIDGAPKTLYGVGCSVGGDADDAAKTALAEAIKKAWHQAGLGLYLWDAAARRRIESSMSVGTAAGRKAALKALAADKLGIENPTLEQTAAAFDIADAEELKTDVKVSQLLAEAGLL